MYIDIPDELRGQDPVLESMRSIGTEFPAAPQRVARGIYLSHPNFEHEYPDLVMNSNPFDGESPLHRTSYGVVDSWQQFLDLPLYADLVTSPRRFVVAFTPERRADQPEHGGWRWHKWGPYLGTQCTDEEMTEYLYDQTGENGTARVDEVFAFQICEVFPSEQWSSDT